MDRFISGLFGLVLAASVGFVMGVSILSDTYADSVKDGNYITLKGHLYKVTPAVAVANGAA